MNVRTSWIRLLAGAALLGAIAHPVRAADPASSATPNPAMEQAMKLGSPGAAHRALDPLVGHFNATIRTWMKPGDPPMVSKGVSDNSWILDGRFVKQDYKGDWNGQPFQGLGLTGYDNLRAEYQSMWIDNMDTGMMTATGNFDATNSTLKQEGHFSCPITGEKDRWYRSELKIVNKDQQVYSSYGKDPTGKEFKGMEIVYTRAK